MRLTSRLDLFTVRRPGFRRLGALVAPALVVLLLGACATAPGQRQPRATERDKTVTGAAVGAAVGAAATAVLLGKREADEILAGAAVGAVTGGSVGWYMDRQEERLARIPGTTVERVADDTLMVHFDSDILFDVDSAVLDSGSRGTLDQVAGVLSEYPKTAVVVQGHTDSTGTETHNQQLSERRAQAVNNYLVGRGVDSGRMTALGYGESMPVASNDTDYGRQQNRRVDILLKAKAR